MLFLDTRMIVASAIENAATLMTSDEKNSRGANSTKKLTPVYNPTKLAHDHLP